MNNGLKEPQIGKMITCLTAGVIFLCFLFFVAMWFSLQDLVKLGQFGDTFGALNALFAGFAFGGLIIALHLQRLEIKHQWKDLKLTRKEITGTNFENSFFQLLRIHANIVNTLRTYISGHRIGLEAFSSLKSQLSQEYSKIKPNEDFQVIWQRFAKRYQRDFDYYFRHLYNTLKFVDEHGFLETLKEKRDYTNLIRGQLSSNEQLLLFYYCLSERGSGLKDFVEKYSILEGMDDGILLDSTHRTKYADSAYRITND